MTLCTMMSKLQNLNLEKSEKIQVGLVVDGFVWPKEEMYSNWEAAAQMSACERL